MGLGPMLGAKMATGIVGEVRFLTQSLEGIRDYTKRVRWRIMTGVW